jgi:hypothetical protein
MPNRSKITVVLAGVLWLAGVSTLSGQEANAFSNTSFPSSIFSSQAALPHMAPELALSTFEQRADRQFSELPSYSAVTRISAELPQSKQSAVFELERHYAAPRTLHFVPVQFSGDDFVKHNVINRLLQQEVDRTEKQIGAQTAISDKNYKFTYKGGAELNGRAVHVYQVKPRTTLAGLFKGHVYLDALTGAMLRAEGKVERTPSFFIKRIEFVTDYIDLNGFSLPIRIHSVADARIIGRVVTDISTTAYNLEGNPAVPAAGPAIPAPAVIPAAASGNNSTPSAQPGPFDALETDMEF